MKCKACGKELEKVVVVSIARQTLNIATDEYTDLEVNETLRAICDCWEELSQEQVKELGLNPEPDHQAALINLVNSAETAGCDGCATVSLEALNQARAALGWKAL